MSEILQRKDQLERRQPNALQKQLAHKKRLNQFLRKMNDVRIDVLGPNTRRFCLRRFLLVTIHKDPDSREIIETNIVLSEDFEFSNKGYYVFFENKKKGEELASLLKSSLQLKLTKFPAFNQSLALLIKSLLFENFKRGELDERRILFLLSKFFDELMQLFGVLKSLVLIRKLKSASMSAKGTIRCRMDLIRLGTYVMLLTLRLGPDGDWKIDFKVLMSETDNFMFQKLKEDLIQLIRSKKEKIMRHKLRRTDEKFRKLIMFIESINWDMINARKRRKKDAQSDPKPSAKAPRN